jgi:predicted MFS family arabinose efflux permease
VVFTDSLGIFLALPLIPLIGREFDATSVQIGYLVGTYSLFNAIGTLWWGVISDYFDKKALLLVNLVGLTCGYIVCATAPSYTVLLCGRAGTGFCAATTGVANSLLFEYSHVAYRARDARYGNVLTNVAITLAPACGGLFIVIGGWRGVMAATSVTCIANFLICAFLAPSDRKHERTTKQDPLKLLWRWLCTERGSIAVFAGHWLMWIGEGLVFATFVLVNSMLYGFTPSENYFSFAMGGAVALVVGLSCDIVSMIGPWWGVVFRSIALALCLLFYIFARFHAVPFVFLAMWTSVFTFGMPATVVLLSACPEEAGRHLNEVNGM